MNIPKVTAALLSIIILCVFLIIVFTTTFSFVDNTKDMQDNSIKATQVFLGQGTP